jgi:hypothetical protein
LDFVWTSAPFFEAVAGYRRRMKSRLLFPTILAISRTNNPPTGCGGSRTPAEERGAALASTEGTRSDKPLFG